MKFNHFCQINDRQPPLCAEVAGQMATADVIRIENRISLCYLSCL
jgi:hypothetical protein